MYKMRYGSKSEIINDERAACPLRFVHHQIGRAQLFVIGLTFRERAIKISSASRRLAAVVNRSIKATPVSLARRIIHV
jgi:hypothetical protein